MSRTQRWWAGAVLPLGLALAGCLPTVPEVVTIETLSPDAAEVLAARDLLDDQVVAVVGRARGLVDRLDVIRHEVARGPAQVDAVSAARADLDSLAADVVVLSADIDALDAEPFAETRQAGADLVGVAEQMISLARADLEELDPVLALDASMAAVVSQWGARGSRPERATQLAALATVADGVVTEARRLDVTCSDLRLNRVRWAELLLVRTQELAVAAENREGDRFDQLRDRYQRAPYGEDRTTADAEARPCWARREPVAELRGDLDAALTRLQASLNGR